MLQALLLSAILMGLAGTPHCAAMCGVACRASAGSARLGWFHLGRLAGYATAGAVAAASVGSLSVLGSSIGVLRPLWTLVHVAALVLGLFLLWQGRQPEWLASMGRPRPPLAAGRPGWQVVAGPVRSGSAGLAWVALPCGLLQSALLVAGLANSAVEGAAVMAGFAIASGAGLLLGPALWWRLAGRRAASAAAGSLGCRVAGLTMAGASAWALGHGLWLRVAAWCLN